MSDVIDHEDTYEAAMERRLSRVSDQARPVDPPYGSAAWPATFRWMDRHKDEALVVFALLCRMQARVARRLSAMRRAGMYECVCPCKSCVMAGPHEDHGHKPTEWVEFGSKDWPWGDPANSEPAA